MKNISESFDFATSTLITTEENVLVFRSTIGQLKWRKVTAHGRRRLEHWRSWEAAGREVS